MALICHRLGEVTGGGGSLSRCGVGLLLLERRNVRERSIWQANGGLHPSVSRRTLRGARNGERCDSRGREGRQLAGSRSGGGGLGGVNGHIVVPITYSTTAGHTARDRCATYETKLSLLFLDLWRGSDSSSGCFWTLFVRLGHTGGFARLSTCTEFIKPEGAWSEVGAFIEATFVANDLPWVEGGATP